MKKILRVITPVILSYFVASSIIFAVSFVYIAMGFFTRESQTNFSYESVLKIITDQSIYWTAASCIVTALILLPFYKKDCILRGKPIKRNALPLKYLPYAALLGIALCFAGNYLLELIQLNRFYPGFSEIAGVLYTPPLIAQFLCIGILIPIGEEMVFRVMCYSRLRDYLPFLPAALFASLLFGLYHGNVVQGVYAFLLSFAMVLAYEHTDSPLIPIIIHMTANITSIMISALPLGPTETSLLVRIIILTASSAVVFYCLFMIKRSDIKNGKISPIQ